MKRGHQSKNILAEGIWSDGTSWKFFISRRKLDPALCTAAFCVTTYNKQLLLVQHSKRGWELPGGHISPGEKVEDALIREVLEESGAVIRNPSLFGHKVVLPKNPIPHRDNPDTFYPFPYSYIPYYYAEASELLGIHTAEEVKDIRLVGFKQARALLAPGHNHDKIINYLIDCNLIKVNK